MDFNGAIKTLRFYLSEQSYLQKITSFEDLKHVQTPAISLVLTHAGNVFYLPEDLLFKKGIFFLNDDWVDLESISKERIWNKDRFTKHQIIKSSIDLFNNLVENKMIKSGYWDLFEKCKDIKLEDSILILKSTPEISEFEELLIVKGPMNKKSSILPEFMNSIKKITEFTYQTTPHAIPPRIEHFLSYRELSKASKLTWDMNQIRAYLGSIWNERTPSTVLSRINLLLESSVLLVEKIEVFNKILQVNKEEKRMVGIPSNFIIGICGGYGRGEYSDTSDLDMLLIHEGSEKQFLQVGEALDQVLQHVPNLELCKLENLVNLNFHEESITNILKAFLYGDEGFLEQNQKKELEKMLSSIQSLRNTPISDEDRKDGIRKYCWSIYKSIINMVPIYEKPIGKGQVLREEITKITKKALPDIIPILLRITESLKDESNALGENLRICQPFLYDSIFKTYSVLTALQDISTILAILSETTFTTSTSDRLKIAIEQNLISEKQGNKLIQGYNCFADMKYKLTREMPINMVEFINEELKAIIKDVYNGILQKLEPQESVGTEYKIVYPLLVFSDLHWGLNNKLAKLCLEEIKKTCETHRVKSILIAGDVFNIDCVNELSEADKKGISILDELSQIQNSLGDQRIHIISGNHDPEEFWDKFRLKLEREFGIYFIGDYYQDENIWIAHGDQDFWRSYNPPLDQYITKFKTDNTLMNQIIIVGHNHRIYDENKLGFYANGTIGKSFSAILINKAQIELIKLPVTFDINLEKISEEYVGITNAEES
ncbi:metallophosphoesterase, partial [Candidatus Hodarchaeum mangrovi]